MGYSTNKPYQRTKYRVPTDSSYDRYLKSGTMVGNKESTLEKPYKTSTYAQMQQDFNFPLPPPFDWGDLPIIPGIDLPPPPGDVIPIGGTGALTCYWTSTGCEQLVGCWAGSDLVLDGPEAATAGYLPPSVSQGEIVQTTISGAENRGIDFVLNPLVPRNTFTVSFKDANGVIASQTIDITCVLSTLWSSYIIALEKAVDCYILADQNEFDFAYTQYDEVSAYDLKYVRLNQYEFETAETVSTGVDEISNIVMGTSNKYVASLPNSGTGDLYIHTRTTSWSSTDTTINVNASSQLSLAIDSSGKLHIIAASPAAGIVYATDSSGSWVSETVDGSGYANHKCICIDSSGTIHIMYYVSGSPAVIKHTYGSYGSWTTETAATLTANSYGLSISEVFIDSSDYLHYTYTDGTSSSVQNIKLYYLTNSTGSWVSTNIYTDPDSYQSVRNNGVVVKSNGNVHVFGGIIYDYTGTFECVLTEWVNSGSGFVETGQLNNGFPVENDNGSHSIAITASNRIVVGTCYYAPLEFRSYLYAIESPI